MADVLITVFTSKLVVIGIDMSVGVLVVVASGVIALEFVMPASNGVDVSSTGKIADFSVDTLANMGVILFVAVMTALRSILIVSLADSVPIC